MSKAEAIRRLTAHWNEQVKLFPSMIETEVRWSSTSAAISIRCAGTACSRSTSNEAGDDDHPCYSRLL
jgi:hypothetical protein